MTLVEAAVHGLFGFTAVLVGCFTVLRQYNICLTRDKNAFSQTFFGRIILGNPLYKWMKDTALEDNMVEGGHLQLSVGFLVALLMFMVLLTNQLMLRSEGFAGRFQPRDDAKIDWKQFWIKQLLVVFQTLVVVVAVLLSVTYTDMD